MSRSPAIINPTDTVSCVSNELDQEYLDEELRIPGLKSHRVSDWVAGWPRAMFSPEKQYKL